MQTENKIFDDFAKMMNGLAGTMAGVGREAQETGREKLKSWLGGMDFVSREEFDAVKAMAAAARDEVAALKAELAASRHDGAHMPTSYDLPDDATVSSTDAGPATAATPPTDTMFRAG